MLQLYACTVPSQCCQHSLDWSHHVHLQMPLALDMFAAALPLACMRCAKRIKASVLNSCSNPIDLSTDVLHDRHLKNKCSGHYSIITVSPQQLMQTQSCTLLVKCAILRSVKTNDCQIGLSAHCWNVKYLQLEARHACCESSAHAALRLIALSVQNIVS